MNGLAFSTLGCPGASADEVLALAHENGCGGVELRCAPNEIIPPDASDELAVQIGQTFTRAGVAVICLASYIQVSSADADLHRHLELARLVGAPFLRVFGGDPAAPDVTDQAVSRLRSAASAAERAGVRILLETHDAFLTGRAVANVLEQVASPAVGALWDVVNPWRAGESFVDTAAALGPWLAHVQVKDVASAVDLTPVLPGTGAIPLKDFAAQLRQLAYSGWVSLEWEAFWYPEAAPLTDALTALRTLEITR